MEKGFLLILIVLFVIPFTSAEVEYIQNKLFIFGEGIFGYSTILNSAFLRYDKSESDFVANNNPLEVSVNFRTYLQKWNNSTESLDVDWCNIAVIYVNSLSDNVTVLYNRTFYPNESDIDSDDFFVKLQDKDIMRTVASCHFVNVQTLNPLYDLDMPLDFNLNTPTWECKACQFYEWEQRIRDVDKAVLLGDNTHTVLSFILRLITLNFEILLILFWIFLIVVFYIALNLIFFTVYWAYSYLVKWAK